MRCQLNNTVTVEGSPGQRFLGFSTCRWMDENTEYRWDSRDGDQSTSRWIFQSWFHQTVLNSPCVELFAYNYSEAAGSALQNVPSVPLGHGEEVPHCPSHVCSAGSSQQL